MFGVNYNLKALQCTIFIKIHMQKCFYALLLILFLLMYCFFFVNYNLISNGKINSTWEGKSTAKVIQHIKSKPSFKSSSESAIAAHIVKSKLSLKPRSKSSKQQHPKLKQSLKSSSRAAKQQHPKLKQSLKSSSKSAKQQQPLLNLTPKPVKTAKSKKPINSVKYYVKTSQCEIPYVNPFTKEILEMFRPIKYKKCTGKLPLYTSTYEMEFKKYILQLNQNFVLKYYPQVAKSKPWDLKCRYRQIKRNENEDTYKLLKFKNLTKKFTVPRNIDSMIVNCALRSTNEEVYSDAFTFVQYKEKLDKRKPGVLLIGIDSLSRINLRRVMPKTFKYLESTWFELQGYNKVADNTFPNVMSILTGENHTTVLDKCQPKIGGGMDSRKCNIIWKSFKKFGYLTAYAEDSTWLSTFNYEKKGFKKQPTDYYSRHWMGAIEENLHVEERNAMPFCIGYKHAGEYVYDYAHQLAKVYEGENIFGLFWTNSYSHENYNDPSMIDDQMVKYFKSLEKYGILDSTIVIFLSDHGSRWGKLVELPEGFFEERLPIFFMSLPKSFEHKHPDFVNALLVNRNRLTSPYDIYMTLNHILELYEPKLKLPHANGCKKCQSIFYTIPENRTCLDAGIEDKWCACFKHKADL